MCEENKELKLNEEESIENLSHEELVEVVYNLLNQQEKEIQVGTEELETFNVDKNEFEKGVKSASEFCGFFSTLVSCGMSTADAYEMTINKQNIDYNMSLNKMTCENNKDIARIQEVKVEQQQI